MSEEVTSQGTLYISQPVLQLEKWMVDQVIASALLELRKYPGADGYLKAPGVRTGDFSMVITTDKIQAHIVNFIGVPGKARASIVQTLYVKE